MKNTSLIIILILSFGKLTAHEGGHEVSLKQWELKATNEILTADFIKVENDQVWLMDSKHIVKAYEISNFSKEDQVYIKARSELIKSLNTVQTIDLHVYASSYLKIGIVVLGACLLLFSVFQLKKRKKLVHVTYGFFGVGMIVFVSCKNTNTAKVNVGYVPQNNVSSMQSLFSKFEGVTTHTDENYFYVSSNGLPGHDMMIGITNWQQQVPINQNYTDDNSWAIPLHPKMAEHPLSTTTNLLKGAIAVAANGIPIFNPLNNRGEDANAIGELDQWGGHCGRADDYHYHLPPLHLQEEVGEGNPVAYAVDGFPVYGETMKTLDDYLGITNLDGSYQYHTIKDYPYFIAGMRGEVILDPKSKAPENQVYPQPRTRELRPALRPLRGAKIVDFKTLGNNLYSLTYQLNSEKYIINYSWDSSNIYTYEFTNPDGTSRVETYKR